MSHLDLIVKAETTGLDSVEEAVALAAALVSTGLVNSTGANQRFVDAMWDSFPDELAEALS